MSSVSLDIVYLAPQKSEGLQHEWGKQPLRLLGFGWVPKGQETISPFSSMHLIVIPGAVVTNDEELDALLCHCSR